MSDTNTTQTNQTSAADVDSVLKKSGVEILDGGNAEDPIGPHDSAEKLKRDFETELGSHSTPTAQDSESGLSASIAHLENAKTKLEHEEKTLGDETQKDIEALKKTKAIIEEKIKKLKEIELKEKEIEGELAEAKDLALREKKFKEDAARISKDTM